MPVYSNRQSSIVKSYEKAMRAKGLTQAMYLQPKNCSISQGANTLYFDQAGRPYRMLARPRLVIVKTHNGTDPIEQHFRALLMRYVPFIDEHSLLSPEAMKSKTPWHAECMLRGITDAAGLVLISETAAGQKSEKQLGALVTVLKHVLVSLDRTRGCEDASYEQKFAVLRAVV